MEHRILAWVLVINERAWFFSVDYTMTQRRVEERFVHCGRLQSRGVEQESSGDEPCWARTNSKKNHVTKNELFDSQKSSNPSWRSWKFDDPQVLLDAT